LTFLLFYAIVYVIMSFPNFFSVLKKHFAAAPNSVLVFAGIGLVSLIAATVLTLKAQSAPLSNVKTPQSNSVSAKSTDNDHSDSNKPKSTNDASDSNAKTATTGNPISGVQTAQNTSVTSSGSSNAAPKTKPQPVRADYNMNDNLYFATSSVQGLINTCWPVAFTAENETACSGGTSDWIIGIGVAKDGAAAQTLADNQATQKAAAQHVDPRRGAGSIPVILTQTICTQYGLSCGRW
jgi:hypothetical protein